MKKVLILNNAYYELESYLYQSKRLKEELELLGAQVTVRKNNFFPCITDGKDIVNNCEGYDFCIYLDKDKYISEMLEKSGLRVINSHKAMVTCDDKMTTYIALSGSGIKTPKTMPGLLCYTKDAEIKQSTIDEIEKNLGYPIIVKKSFGSLGKGVYKADNRQELELISRSVMFEPHHYQEYISESAGRDLRVIVIGGKFVCAMQRKSETDFRSNVELGGEGKIVDVPKEFIEVAENTAKALNLDYCGIDLLYGKDCEPIVCEVNSNAFFGGIERVTGKNVAKAYAEYLLSKY